MKIAVCLSGHYRNFDYNYDSWNQFVFSKYDCDVFLHTWDVKGNRESGGDANVQENMDIITDTADDLKRKYGFKDAVIQDYKEPIAEFIEKSRRVRELRNNSIDTNNESWKKRRVTHLYSMWYKAHKCFELVEKTNTKYDLVIKCRPDVRINDTFNLDDVDVDVINWPWYNNKLNHYSEPHDCYAVGNYENMKIYNNLYNHIEEMESVLEIEKPIHSPGNNVEIPGVDRFLNPHTLLFFYIKHMGLETKVIDNHGLIIRG